jgi:hypothetical protein
MKRWHILALSAIALAASAQSQAIAPTQSISQQVLMTANKHRVPAEVFYSLLMLESGMRVDGKTIPWHWTLNVNHKPYRYKSYDETKAALLEFLKNPKNTIAVGAGQIYIPAHGHVFDDVTDLVDPAVNLNYSAKLLSDEFNYLKRQGKANWWTAAGRYHAPNNRHHARVYRSIVFMKCRKISAQCTMYGKIS